MPVDAGGPLRILNISDSVEIEGGRETYLKQLTDRVGTSHVRVSNLSADEVVRSGSPTLDPGERGVALFHSRSAWGAVRSVRGFGRIGWVHDHAIYSVGGMSWFPTSGEECDIRVGARCLARAYTRRCANRRPDRLVSDWSATKKSYQALSEMDGMIVASRYMRDRLVQIGVGRDRITVIPYFVDDSFIDADVVEAPDRGRLLYVGRLHESKGVHVLLEAMKHVRSKCSLRIVGGGLQSYELTLRKRVNGLREAGFEVEFFPFTSDRAELRDHYDQADVVAIPSLWPEPFGIVGLEAMSRARPVVAFDVGGISDWLVDGKVGYLATPGDPVRMATLLEQLLQDRALREQQGAAGRDHVGGFSWDRHWASLLALSTKVGSVR